MAISPTVNAHMQQTQGQPQSAEQLFNQQFTSQAHNTFQAKYPGLVNSIVTLKVLSSDIDDGSAFGVFVLKKGTDLVFVPVVMSSGSITSCEMVYEKAADQFTPLTDSIVKELQAATNYADPTILGKKPPYVEDTRTLFRNMIRPPVSSNVILAGERGGITSLPNHCKAALSNYLEKENPKLLAKIAAFYDVTALATKLAAVPEPVKEKEVILPSFLRLDALSKEAASLLQEEERKALLRDGYFIKESTEGDTLHVSSADNLMQDVETELRLSTYPDLRDGESGHHYGCMAVRGQSDLCIEHFPVSSAELVHCTSKGVDFTPVLLCGRDIIANDTYSKLSPEGTALISNHLDCPEQVTKRLDAFNIIFPISKLQERLSASKDEHLWMHMHLFIPARKSGWLFVDTNDFLSGSKSDLHSTEYEDQQVISGRSFDGTIVATPKVSKGYIVNGRTLMVPQDTRCMLSTSEQKKPLPFVSSFDVFRRLISSLGAKLVRTDNGAGISITDMSKQKTASFRTPADAASWLHDTYGMNGQQVRTVLGANQCYVFSKRAFMEGIPEQGVEPGYGQMPEQGSMEQPAEYFDPSYLDDYADLGDEEMLDTGILASFAQDPDIKGLLVDYLPDFLQAQDRLGRIILLMSSQKADLEDFYSSEKYATLISSCRKIFQVIGDLVVNLKTYINMQ